MPYRIDLADPPGNAAETLIDLGALDVEPSDAGLAALMPDSVPAAAVATALGVRRLRVSPAIGRDADSVWMLRPRPVRVGPLLIAPAGTPAAPDALTLVDAPAFGTGLHATTALCLEAILDLAAHVGPDRLLDVGTGSGILALAALRHGVATAVGLDLDATALAAAAANARNNGLSGRLSLVRGGPESLRGAWPLVTANIRAAELMAMAATLARRLAHGGHLVLSGIPASVAPEVELSYRRLGMTRVGQETRDGWTALVMRPTW